MRSTHIFALCLLLNFLARASAVPVISDFTPTAGTAGDQVQLAGSGFSTGSITVRFWNGAAGVVAPIVFINSDTIMTVTVPSGISTGPISIQQGAGSQSFTANDFLAVGAGPFIMSFSPLYGSVNDTVAITGVHLGQATGVFFHGVAVSAFTPNAAGTQITTRVPGGATTGLIAVSSSNGTSNSPAAFTVVGAGPYITDFSPISGDAGTKVQIDGLHFTGVTNVAFNGKPGIIVNANSDTLLQVLAPTGVVSGPISVSTTLGKFVTSSNFFGKPTITSLSPISGRAGTNVLITGKNLIGATSISFNGVAATSFSVVNNTNISVVVPVGATSGLVRAVVPGASAFSATNFIVAPTLVGFSPSFGPVGTLVTITGANLNAGSVAVKFNGIPTAAPTTVTFGSLVARVPAGATTGHISLTTVDGANTSAGLFYLPAAIKSVSSTNSPPGSRITITGTNFTGTTAVSFNGVPAAGFTVTNNTSLAATVPSNVITGPISLTTPAGSALSSAIFYGAPVITNFTPTHGAPGTNVTINGFNFLGGTVKFGQLNAAIVSLNNTQIVATVPAGAQSGPIKVLGPAGTNTSAIAFIIAYDSNLQVGLTNSPNVVTLGSNLTYTISIFNAGPSAAPNVTLTNILPPNVILRSIATGSPWLIATNGNVITATAANFPYGNASSLTLVVSPQSAGPITNTVFVGSDNPDPSPQDNFAVSTALVLPLPVVTIARTAGKFTLSWPVALTNYVLQFEDTLTSVPHWVPVTGVPVISGGLEVFTETNNGAARFYRLHK